MNQSKRPKKPVSKDWHRADIVAELHKRGVTLRRLAIAHGYKSPTTLTKALDRPWPRGEQIIAKAIGLSAAEIWPSRYPIEYHTKGAA